MMKSSADQMDEEPNQKDPNGQSSATQRESSHNAFPLIIGEVLWDCFDDHRVLGGAPLNVAWNLAGLGLNPLFVSAVGDDELGHEILARMKQFGMVTDGVAVLPGAATGTVAVTMEDGEPHYDIVRGVAWDAIPAPAQMQVNSGSLQDIIEARMKESDAALMYHGSLACRDVRSRKTIETIRNHFNGDIFFDVNLRAPHFEKSLLNELRPHATHIKLNLDELGELAEGIEANTDPSGQATPEQTTTAAGAEFSRTARRPLKSLLVTLGAMGALAYQPESQSLDRVKSPKPETMADPVGAGDAFAAVTIHGILTGRAIEETLPDAVAFASRVCGLSGATCSDRNFYSLETPRHTK